MLPGSATGSTTGSASVSASAMCSSTILAFALALDLALGLALTLDGCLTRAGGGGGPITSGGVCSASGRSSDGGVGVFRIIKVLSMANIDTTHLTLSLTLFRLLRFLRLPGLPLSFSTRWHWCLLFLRSLLFFLRCITWFLGVVRITHSRFFFKEKE